MKKILCSIVVIMLLVCCTAALIGCQTNDKDLSTRNGVINVCVASADIMDTAYTLMTVTDKGIEVYNQRQDYTLRGTYAEVTTTTTTLGDNFAATTETDQTTLDNIDRTGLLRLDMDVWKNLKLTEVFVEGVDNVQAMNADYDADHLYTASVAASDVNALLRIDAGATADCQDEAHVVIQFKDGKMTQATIAFVNTAGRSVVITVGFGYTEGDNQ